MKNNELSIEQSRLKTLVDKSELSRKEFAIKYHITYEALKSYIYGNRTIPIELLIEIAKDNDLSLDWFYGISEDVYRKDSLVQIVNALSKVLTISIRKTPYCETDHVLLIDKRFRNLLYDIQSFCYFKEHSIQLDKVLFNEQRKKIYEKHEKFLIELLGEVNFNENDAFEIYGVKSKNYNNPGDSILNYLASEE